jgi:hypothetical protein
MRQLASEMNAGTKEALTKNDLPNPYDATDIHEHNCRNCGKRFYCALPLCNGSWLDPELCENCEEVLKGIWFPL